MADTSSFIFCGLHSQLRWSSSPALVPEGQATQAFSLGHSILPRDLVLPQSHTRVFVLQLGQMFHAAVHLQVHTVRQKPLYFYVD